jgi:uncharacterized caspase-like protein
MSRLAKSWLTLTLLGSSLAAGWTGCATTGIEVPLIGDQQRAKGFEDARSTQNQLAETAAPRRWAVLIGINDYEDPTFGGLRYATRDARDMGWILKHPKYGAFDRVITLTQPEQLERAALLTELNRLRSELRRQDTLVVYFSGHGTMEFSSDGRPLLYLVAKDTRVADLYGTAIELDALRAFLSSLRAQRKVLILDCCFAGAGKSRVTTATRVRLDAQPAIFTGFNLPVGQSEAILMASTLGGVAVEDDQLQHSTYTSYLLKALGDDRVAADANGDGAVTAYEAHDFARSATLQRSNHKQIPEGYFRVVGRADMFLSGAPSAVAAREAALVYEYGTGRGLALEVDGRAKGRFPQTIAIEPGNRRLKVTDDSGRVIAENTLELASGQTWSVPMLIDALQGYRRFFGVQLGGGYATGELATPLRGGLAPELAVTSGYRVKGGTFRGLSLGFTLGFSPTGLAGDSVGALEQSVFRPVFDLGASAVLRRPVGRIQLGAGWYAGASFIPPSADAESSTAETWRVDRSWLLLPGGPILWQGYPLNHNMTLTLEARGSFFMGNPDGDAEGRNFIPSVRGGLEVGF